MERNRWNSLEKGMDMATYSKKDIGIETYSEKDMDKRRDIEKDINMESSREEDGEEGEAALRQAIMDVNDFFSRKKEKIGFRLHEKTEEIPVEWMLKLLLKQAYQKGASDIHIEPTRTKLHIRLRINGDLISYASMKTEAHAAIVTKIKIMGGMNIAEKRVPQDGKYTYTEGNVSADIRISTLPTLFGEHVVMRILGGSGREKLMEIQNLGMTPEQMQEFEQMLKSPNGMLLVSGPTGSGKTTTLYAVLHQMLQKPIHIITVEEPVEKVMDGVTQVQVNPKAGLTFQTILRAILRQDPDVIMIGEIRDGETASIGVRAAVTGHLVLASIHTNDCASSVIRLLDMGVPSYMAAAAISGIVSQRLVKLLCPYCKESYVPDNKDMKGQLLFGTNIPKMVWRAKGCEHCNGTGYIGRRAVYEMVRMDETLSTMVSKEASVQEIREYERRREVVFLRDSVRKLVLEGETSLEEMEKIVYSVN